MIHKLSATDARTLIHAGDEVALLDVREAGQFGEGHALLAIPAPYSTLERDVRLLVPRPGATVILMDGSDGVAERAAGRLTALGYTHVRVMDGGLPAWRAAGFPVYKGVNVPSKLFGELVEHERGTPSISADELRAMQDRGEPLVVLDGRSPEEFHRMSIPGGLSCPNAELPLRLESMLAEPQATVVINCAGRTRSIMGAQGLLDTGCARKVVALRNGTMGWRLAGHELSHGRSETFAPDVSAEARSQALAEARRLAGVSGVPSISAATLDSWRTDATRTLYVLDVRSAEEFATSHLPGAVHAPGGQLVQATDQWIAVRGARIVLTDPLGIRAALSAHWLRGMGHDACMLEPADAEALLERPSPSTAAATEVALLDGAGFARALADGATCIDLRSSAAHRAGHPAGATWNTRAGLAASVTGGAVVLLADDAQLAALAAADVAESGGQLAGVAVLDRGEWENAGLRTESTPDQPSDEERIDFLFFVHDRHSGNLAAAQVYLDWETGLLAQMDEPEQALFHVPAA